jgi:hypothetical protein
MPSRSAPTPVVVAAARGAGYRRSVPDARCPTCQQWAPRQAWEAVPPGSFPFTSRCPACAAVADVAEIGYRTTTTPPEVLPGS